MTDTMKAGLQSTPALSPLARMTTSTPTSLWNDSADPSELSASLEFGAVGATCNPVIALAAIKADFPRWRSRIEALAESLPTASEDEIGWKVVEEVSIEAAALLEPTFRKHRGRNGRLSIQTDPRNHRNVAGLVEQAVAFDQLAPNMIVKIPATEAGIAAIEEVTYRGISINATVSFTVAQCLAVGEAVEAGLRRREAEGLPVDEMGPVCTLMVGRLDDWIKVAADQAGVLLDPGVHEWAGVAAFKNAYSIFEQRGYRTRMLSAAFRNHLHWSQLVGGDVVISPPFSWQVKINNSGLDAAPHLDDPVAPEILDSLTSTVREFRKAYDPDGLTPAEFDSYGATRRTLRQFLAANNELEALVRDVLVPAPGA
jgi:transaldolase